MRTRSMATGKPAAAASRSAAAGGPLGGVVGEQITRLGLTNLVRYPFHKPFSELLAVTDLLVLPSEYEGMPMVVVESLATGIPVVATDVGNNREVLERTGGGIIVHIGDVGGMRRAVRKLLAEPPDPAALRAAVERAFQLGPMAEAYYRAFTAADPLEAEGFEGSRVRGLRNGTRDETAA